GKTASNPGWGETFGSDEAEYLGTNIDKAGVDVSLYAAVPPGSTRQRYAEQLAQARKTFQANPKDLNALYQASEARYRLGQDREALADLDVLIAGTTNPAFADGYRFRALVQARLGDGDAALRDLAAFRKRSTHAGLNTAVPAIVLAYLG